MCTCAEAEAVSVAPENTLDETIAPLCNTSLHVHAIGTDNLETIKVASKFTSRLVKSIHGWRRIEHTDVCPWIALVPQDRHGQVTFGNCCAV